MQQNLNLNLEEMEDLARRDILAYGIMHIDLLQNRQWEVKSRAWVPEIYTVVNPREIQLAPQGLARTLSIQKSTQCGMSTMATVRMFHLADFWSMRLMYMLPRQQDYIDFVTTRIDPMISASERLSKLLGSPDSTRAKQLGESYLFFMESTVEPRMMPADAVFVDELDLSDMTNVSTLDNRMDASDWKLKFYFSTPTLPNYGINGTYGQSDMREWMLKCDHCGNWQDLDWDKQLRVVGPKHDPKDVFFACLHCGKPITLENIQKGTWVPAKPERSSKHIGFHISQMMTHTPTELYQHFIDPHTKIYEFYRKRLGKPYEIGIGSLEREDMLATCFDEPYDYEKEDNGKDRYFMGVDQGNELQVLIGKIEKGNSRPKIVHVEFIPYEEGGFDRVGRLMRLYNIRKAVIDGDPNRHSARDLQKSFLSRIYIADYAESKVDWQTKKDPKSGITTNVVIGRSEGFDRLIESIKDGEWQLPGMLPNLSPDTETIIDHVTALKRDVETRNTPSGEREVAVWRELRASHLAHAWLYLKTAIEIDRGKDYKIAVIGKNQKARTQETTTVDGFSKTSIVRITSLLAEVPLNQLQKFLSEKKENAFPLKVKLEKIREEGFTEDEISYVAKILINDKLLKG